MSITTKIINDNKYVFVNSSRSNRSGFVHETKLYKNDTLISEYKIQYYNRTWEVYAYQSVMRGAVNALIGEVQDIHEKAYRQTHNIKRLTKAKKADMKADFENNPPALYLDLEKLYATL